MTLQNYLLQGSAIITAAAEDNVLSEYMRRAIDVTINALKSGKPLLTCGNGGSAADASHIAGELVGRFLLERKPYNVISLVDNSVALTAIANDYSYEDVFAKQVLAYGSSDAVLLGISTSGNSKNVVKAFEAAKMIGVTTIGMTGYGGGKMAPLSDILLAAPSSVTAEIQQVHICLYHYFCREVEKALCA